MTPFQTSCILTYSVYLCQYIDIVNIYRSRMGNCDLHLWNNYRVDIVAENLITSQIFVGILDSHPIVM